MSMLTLAVFTHCRADFKTYRNDISKICGKNHQATIRLPTFVIKFVIKFMFNFIVHPQLVLCNLIQYGNYEFVS